MISVLWVLSNQDYCSIEKASFIKIGSFRVFATKWKNKERQGTQIFQENKSDISLAYFRDLIIPLNISRAISTTLNLWIWHLFSESTWKTINAGLVWLFLQNSKLEMVCSLIFATKSPNLLWFINKMVHSLTKSQHYKKTYRIMFMSKVKAIIVIQTVKRLIWKVKTYIHW